MPAKKRNWIQEERRKTLGDYTCFCLDCGSVWRYFLESESELPDACPNCGGETRHRCPECSAPFPSAFAVECEDCGAGSAAARGARRPDPQDPAAQPGGSRFSSSTSTGSSRPFTCTVSSGSVSAPQSCRAVSALIATPPGGASPSIREPRLTVSPIAL